MISPFNDEYFMKQALSEAEKALEDGEIPVGAIIVCNNRIIARAYNQVEKLNDVTAHAEMLAITAAQNHLGSKYLDQCTMYVTLEPCVMCGGALFWTQLQKLVFAASDDQRGYGRVDHQVLHPQTTVESGLLAAESKSLIKTFFNRIRRNLS